MSAAKGAYKSLKRIPKQLKRLPKKLLKLPRKIWKLLVGLASRVAILPLDTLSGKSFAVTLFLLVVALVGGVLYLAGGAAAETGWFVLVYVGTAAAIAGVVFLVSYPLDKAGIVERLIVKTGMRQRNRISPGLFAVVFGFLLAASLTVLIDYVVVVNSGSSYSYPQPDLVFVSLFVFLLVVLVLSLFFVFQEKSESLTCEDLSIVEINQDESGERELVVQNHSDNVVTITNGKIKDTEGNRYSLDRDLRFRPGEKESIEIPSGFSLETIERDTPAGVGRFYEKKITSIYARSGDTYILEWTE